MKLIKKIFLFFIIFNISSVYAKSAPDSFADLAEKLMPSVVNISTTQTVKTNSNSNPFPFKFPPGSPFGEMFKDFENQQPTERKASALGSGFIIKEEGVVITNNHVIANAEDILVRVGDKEYKAKLVGADPYMDVAVLKMETKDKFKTVKFGDSDLARVGDWAMAIGNPFGLGGTVTAGIISARNRDINLTRYDDFIQTDASINQGNSGGPLFNLKGEVIGINTAILGQGGSIGIGFAIPANAASNVIDQLIEFGETKRGWLGVRIQEVTKEIAEVEKLKKPQGALVASVGENSPADKAGVKAGDIILEFDGKKIDTMRKLPKVVANTKVGKSVQLKIWRNKKSITKKLTLGRLESSEEFKEKKIKTVKKKEKVIKSLKISVREVNDNDISTRNLNKNTKGVVITNIENKSPLVSVLSVNDIIIEVQKNPVKNSSDLKNIVDGIFKKGEKTLLLTVIDQNNRRRYLGVKIN
ncbi:Do family serine endopeptidase [Candidatus Pelagibacter bacterium]|jgi:serine protease Do|nr:Do family serine endopeptidase [Candidatus Pelagibacter bacterium]MDA8772513.1 Do family serine endopeptidase [Candidatus Pelagibacter bacterium]